MICVPARSSQVVSVTFRIKRLGCFLFCVAPQAQENGKSKGHPGKRAKGSRRAGGRPGKKCCRGLLTTVKVKVREEEVPGSPLSVVPLSLPDGGPVTDLMSNSQVEAGCCLAQTELRSSLLFLKLSPPETHREDFQEPSGLLRSEVACNYAIRVPNTPPPCQECLLVSEPLEKSWASSPRRGSCVSRALGG